MYLELRHLISRVRISRSSPPGSRDVLWIFAGCRARSRALTLLCSATPQRITAPAATRRLDPVVSEPTW